MLRLRKSQTENHANGGTMNRIQSIHYLRGIAALLVVAYHNRSFSYEHYTGENWTEVLFQGGAFGVDLFFLISGFIIAYSTRRAEHSHLSDYVLRRFFRIYPVFWLVLIAYILSDNSFTFWNIIRSAFLLHNNYSGNPPFFEYNILYPAWSMTYEIYFYIIFAISMKLSHKYRVMTTTLILVFITLILQLFYNSSFSIYENVQLHGAIEKGLGFLNFIASPLMFNFIAGMAIYTIHDKMHLIKAKGLLSFVFINVFLCMYLYNYHYKHGIYGFGLWAIFLITGSLLYEARYQLTNFAPLIILGDISYSLYLVHPLVMHLMAANHESIPMYEKNSPAKFLMIVSTSLVAAYLLHHFVELPAIKLGKIVINYFHKRNKLLTAK